MSELAVRHSNAVAEYETEFRQVDPTGGRLIAWADSLSAAHRLATALCETSFVPKHFANKPIEAAAALLLGDELGLSPVSALRSIFVISGTPGLYAKSMVALVQSRGHEVWTEKDTAEEVAVCGRRNGSEHVERSVWTTARARKAGYTNNKKYETDPQAMLYARAASDVCRKIAADVLAGVPHAVEELELEAAPKKATATVKRAAIVAPEPEFDTPAELAPEAERPADVTPEPDITTPSSPGSITAPQLKKLHVMLNKVGIVDRDDGLAYYLSIIDREVDSSKSLSKQEAVQIIDALERIEAEPVDAEVAEPDPTLEPGFGGQA